MKFHTGRRISFKMKTGMTYMDKISFWYHVNRCREIGEDAVNSVFIREDALSVWTNLGKYFVVGLVIRLKCKDGHDALCVWTICPS